MQLTQKKLEETTSLQYFALKYLVSWSVVTPRAQAFCTLCPCNIVMLFGCCPKSWNPVLHLHCIFKPEMKLSNHTHHAALIGLAPNSQTHRPPSALSLHILSFRELTSMRHVFIYCAARFIKKSRATLKARVRAPSGPLRTRVI